MTDFVELGMLVVSVASLLFQIWTTLRNDATMRSRKTWGDDPKPHPFPDAKGNRAKVIRWLFYSRSAGEIAFAVGTTAATIGFLMPIIGGSPSPLGLIIGGVSTQVAGAVTYRLASKALNRGKRRYILGKVAAWTGLTGDEGEYEDD